MDVRAVAAPPLDASIAVDVAIVGSGIAGASVAYELLQRGLSVAVLDLGPMARGMTARTSAHLAFQSDDLFQEVISQRGKDVAKLHYQSQRAAVDRIESIQSDEDIECDFVRLDGLLALADETEASVLKEELKACHRIGYREASLVTTGRIERMKSPLGLRCPQQARFHPLKYVDGMLKVLKTRRARLHANTCVQGIKENTEGVELKTEGGHTIRAAAAVIATNSPIDPRFAIHTKQAPYRSYVIAAPIAKDSVPDVLYWDTADPYHYVRLQPQDGHDLLISGGEDHRPGTEDDAEARLRNLEDWTRARFPEMGKVQYRWSGQVLEPIDYTAFIGLSPGRKHVYMATGDSGQGLTHGAVAGILITDLITKKSNPWAELHDPSRKTLSAAGEFIKENIAAAQNLTEYVTPGELESADKCKPGQGGILRDGLEKLAVCRSEDGKLHILSAICPHAGCIVHWNSFEQCWDCPCHGSHFAPDGAILNAPTTSPLKPAKVSADVTRHRRTGT